MNRDAIIQHLTNNCDCWKGQDKVLANFSDEMLGKLKAHHDQADVHQLAANTFGKLATEYGVPPTTTLNELPDALEAAMAEEMGGGEEDEEEEEEEEVEATQENGKPAFNFAGPKKGSKKPVTINEWLNDPSVPNEVKSLVENARKDREQKKFQLVSRLMSNIRNNEERQARGELLMNKSLEAVQEIYSYSQAANQQPRQQAPETPAFNFGNDAGINRVTDNSADDNDVSDMEPATLNYDEMGKSQKVG